MMFFTKLFHLTFSLQHCFSEKENISKKSYIIKRVIGDRKYLYTTLIKMFKCNLCLNKGDLYTTLIKILKM